MKSWWLPGKKRVGAREGSERKQLGEGNRAFAYGKFSLSPTVYQRCILQLRMHSLMQLSRALARRLVGGVLWSSNPSSSTVASVLGARDRHVPRIASCGFKLWPRGSVDSLWV